MAWDDDKATAADPDNPSANEQLTATEWDRHVINQKDGQVPDYVVYQEGGTWYADGPSGTSGTSGADPATVLQHAATNGNVVLLCDSIGTNDPLTSTVTFSGTSLVGPGSRGQAEVYVDGEQTTTGIKVTGTGAVRNLWLRGDPDSATASFTTVDLLRLEDMGRGSIVDNVSFFGTRGNGMVVAGCQQMGFSHITTSTCGDPSSDTWHIYLTDSPTDSLETNANVWVDIQRHGASNTDGGWIAMRTDEGSADTDYPRTQHFVGFNVENGPTDTGTPMIEIAGRDHMFAAGRIGGIDEASDIFKVPTGAGRARDTILSNLRVIATATTTNFWNANGIAVSNPYISNCQIDVGGTGVLVDNPNQADNPIKISNCDFKSTPTIVSVTASQDAGKPVLLSNVAGTGEISVQGSRLAVSNVSQASWDTTHNADFGPRLISDDGSFTPATFTAQTNASGLAEQSFSGDFELKDGEILATTPRGDGTVVEGVSLNDTSANGDLDTARAHVVNVADGTDAGSITVSFTVLPRRP